MTTIKRRVARRVSAGPSGSPPPLPAIAQEPGARLLEGAVEVPKNLKIFIYGFSDAGKTVLASGLPSRDWPKDADGNLLPIEGHPVVLDDVLYCDADGGTNTLLSLGVLVKHMHPRTGRFTTTAQMEEIPGLVKGTGVSRVVIDTFSRYQESLMNPRMQADYSFRLQDWGYIRNVFSKMSATLEDLGVDLIGTAHADEREDETQPRIRRENPVTHKPEVVHPTRILPAIQGAFRNLVHGHFDVVAFYRLEWDSEGNPVRKLYTRPTRSIAARSRLALLPSVIENPDWPMIKNLWVEGRERLIKALKAQNPDLTID